MHEDRGAARADRLRDLLEDERRGGLHRHRAAEDLADRVEEIDLLVSLGELVGGVLDLERRLQRMRDDGQQELQIERRAVRSSPRARSDDEPRAARAGDRLRR